MDGARSHKTNFRLNAMAAALWAVGLMPAAVQALSIGEPELKSRMSERLKVTVPVALNGLEPDALLPRLLPADAYALMGLPPPVLRIENLSVNIEPVAFGSARVTIESPEPVREPVVELLLELRAGDARMIRELTLFLELPPSLAAQSQPPQARVQPPAPPVIAPAPEADVARVTPSPAVVAPVESASPAPRAAAPAPAFVAPAERSGSDRYGPVQYNENLSQIANRVLSYPRGALLRATAALALANPEAFDNGNPNALRRGVMLRLPSSEDIAAVSDEQAARILGTPVRSARAVPAPALEVAAPAAADASIAPLPRFQLVERFDSYRLWVQTVAAPTTLAETGATSVDAAMEPAVVAAESVVTPAADLVAAEPVTPPAVAVANAEMPAEDSNFLWWLMLGGLALAANGVALNYLRKRMPATAAAVPAPVPVPAAAPAAPAVPVEVAAPAPVIPPPAVVAPRVQAAAEPPRPPQPESNVIEPPPELRGDTPPLRLVRSETAVKAEEVPLVTPDMTSRLRALGSKVGNDDALKRRLSLVEIYLERGQGEKADKLLGELEAQLGLAKAPVQRAV